MSLLQRIEALWTRRNDYLPVPADTSDTPTATTKSTETTFFRRVGASLAVRELLVLVHVVWACTALSRRTGIPPESSWYSLFLSLGPPPFPSLLVLVAMFVPPISALVVMYRSGLLSGRNPGSSWKVSFTVVLVSSLVRNIATIAHAWDRLFSDDEIESEREWTIYIYAVVYILGLTVFVAPDEALRLGLKQIGVFGEKRREEGMRMGIRGVDF